MIRFMLKLLGICAILLLILAISMLRRVDRTPYQETAFYAAMDQRLDSLQKNLKLNSDSSMLIGWSSENITPDDTVPLAGFGGRDPKEMTGIHDSSFVRTILLQNHHDKVAFISADLLIIHPELSRAVWAALPEGWRPSNVYFTATHTHSGQGGWAPGSVGYLFAGEYDSARVKFLATKILKSIRDAETNLRPGTIAAGEMEVSHLVKNRLVKDQGIIDPWLKAVLFMQDSAKALFTFYSAHATSFGPDNHQLSGDYPAALVQRLKEQTDLDLVAFGAGAVGSMGLKADLSGEKGIHYTAFHLADQLQLFMQMGGGFLKPDITTLQLTVPMREPEFKLTKNIALRSYLFDKAFGAYSTHLSVAIIGQCIFIGMPCDFSGELAVPLYEKARDLGYELIITSFNGDYDGYVIKDDWYDLSRYESRTMSWYGPDAGSYFSEIISRVIDSIHAHS